MNTLPKTAMAAIAAACLVLLAPLVASADDAHHAPHAAATAGDAELTDGEVRKVDLAAGKLTLRHAEIKNLDMPAMTMVFVVKDKAMLDKLKTGDKVKFKVVNDGSKFTVTEIQPAP